MALSEFAPRAGFQVALAARARFSGRNDTFGRHFARESKWHSAANWRSYGPASFSTSHRRCSICPLRHYSRWQFLIDQSRDSCGPAFAASAATARHPSRGLPSRSSRYGC